VAHSADEAMRDGASLQISKFFKVECTCLRWTI
jgi:hypothetical protein